MSSTATLADAYARCEAITRSEAANFYYGIRLLSGPRRRAICAVYAFARRVDDIGDGELPREQKLAMLARQAGALSLAEAGRDGAPDGDGAGAPGAPDAADPVMIALRDAYRRFPLPPGALGELIEGVRMDVAGETYESFEELVLYCRRVAGAIGRVCLAVFGLRRSSEAQRAGAEALADELGVAMQLTNILRDIREDAQNGRVYLPAEDLRRFGLLGEMAPAGEPGALARLLAGGAPAGTLTAEGGRLPELVRFEADRARVWFDRGMTLTEVLDWRSAASVRAMAGIYRRLLERIDADPEAATTRRISLPAREKAWVALTCMLGGGG